MATGKRPSAAAQRKVQTHNMAIEFSTLVQKYVPRELAWFSEPVGATADGNPWCSLVIAGEMYSVEIRHRDYAPVGA